MIRDLICPLLFQKYLKMMSRQTAVLLKKSISDDYITYKIVCVRIFYITFASTLINKLICYG